MKSNIAHLNPAGMHTDPAFTHAVAVAGAATTVYIGGQNAVTTDGRVVGVGDLAAQTEQVFMNLATVLAAAGAALADVVKWTLYLVQGQEPRAAFAVFERVRTKD